MNSPTARHSLPRLTWLLLLAAFNQAYAVDLQDAYRLAQEHDARYQSAKAAAAAGQEALPQATAQLLPMVSGSGTRAKANADVDTGNVRAHNDYFTSNYALQLRQPLFRPASYFQYGQAKARVAGTDAQLVNERESMAQRVVADFFEALMARDQLAFILAQKEAYALQLKAATQSLGAGLGTRTDIDDAQARFDLTRALELEAKQNVDYTRRRLETLIDQPAGSLPYVDPARMVLQAPSPADSEEWIQRSEAGNPELQALKAAVDVAALEVKKAISGHFPTADLFVQRGRAQSETVTSINTTSLTTQMGVQVNIPIFAGGYVNSQVRQAEAALQKARQDYEARRLEMSLEVRKEYQNVTEGILRVEAHEQAERSATQAVYSNKKGFQAGVRTRVDILNAEQQLMNARRDLAQARYQYLVAKVRLESLANANAEQAISSINRALSNASQLLGATVSIDEWNQAPASPAPKAKPREKQAAVKPVQRQAAASVPVKIN